MPRRRCRSRSATRSTTGSTSPSPSRHMDGRRIYHARGKVLGGSPLDQRDDLPARQPDGLRALGRRPRHGDLGLPPLPALLQAHGVARPARRAGRRRRLARRRRARSMLEREPGDEPALQRVLRGRPAGRLPADRRRQRLPPGGLRALRPQHRQGRADVRRPRLPAPGDEAARTSRSRRFAHATGSASRASAPSASTTSAPAGGTSTVARRRGHPVRRRDQHPAAAAALGRRRPRAPAPAGRRDGPRPPGRRREPAGPPRGLHPVRLARSRSRSSRA